MLLLSDYIARLEEGVIRTSDLLSGELSDSDRARLVAALDRFGAQLVAARVSLDQLGDVTVALHAGAREALGFAPVSKHRQEMRERGAWIAHEERQVIRGELRDRYAMYVECAPPGEILSFDEWLNR